MVSCLPASLPLLNVTSLTCSLPSLLGFASKFLGNDPGCLLVNNMAIWPICTSRFLSWPFDFIVGWIGSVAAKPDFGIWPSTHS